MLVWVHQLDLYGQRFYNHIIQVSRLAAQVWKKGVDLRHGRAQKPDLRRRSQGKNHTCARKDTHLRQKRHPPAPEKTPTCAKKRRYLHR